MTKEEQIAQEWINRIGLKQFNQLKNAIKIYNYIHEKEKFHYVKWNRARKSETQDFHWEKYKLYSSFSCRCGTLIFALKSSDKFGSEYSEWLRQTPEEYKERVKKRKDEGRLKFESQYRVYLHFFQNRLGADYGNFECDKCERTFYHSPSEVYKGKEKKYSNCCGNCVNSIMRRNQQEEVFV